jgi:VWFA-related protein
VKRAIIFFIIFLFASTYTVSAQETTPTPPPVIAEDDEVLTIESRLIIVPVSVTDGNGNPVKGLTKEDFRLREKNKAQEIAEVSAAEKVPLEIALLFDVSASTDPMFKFEQETAAKFLQDVMRPEDRATIFTIGEMPVLLQNRNVAYQSIETIRNIQPTKQYTAFYDTVTAAAVYLQKNAPARSRKIIIAITDGEDTNSIGVKLGFSQVYAAIDKQKNTVTSEQLRDLLTAKRNEIRVREQNKTLARIQDADTVFYSINPAGSSYQLNQMSKFGQENMERFANETGGTAFLPKFLPIDLKSNYENNANLKQNTQTLETIFRQLASELQSQYLIQYYSESEYPEGTFVDIDVKVNLNLPQGVKVRARQGYFVKNQ